MTQKKWYWYYSREAILNEDASITWADHDAKNAQEQTAEDFLANGRASTSLRSRSSRRFRARF